MDCQNGKFSIKMPGYLEEITEQKTPSRAAWSKEGIRMSFYQETSWMEVEKGPWKRIHCCSSLNPDDGGLSMVPVFGFNGSTSFRSLADERFQDELPTGLENLKKTFLHFGKKKIFWGFSYSLPSEIKLFWIPGTYVVITQILGFVIILLQWSNYHVPESAGENGCYLNSLIIQ